MNENTITDKQVIQHLESLKSQYNDEITAMDKRIDASNDLIFTNFCKNANEQLTDIVKSYSDVISDLTPKDNTMLIDEPKIKYLVKRIDKIESLDEYKESVRLILDFMDSEHVESLQHEIEILNHQLDEYEAIHFLTDDADIF